MAPNHKLQKTLRTPSAGQKPRKLSILVMGLTGAGKSTFISVLTGKYLLGDFSLFSLQCVVNLNYFTSIADTLLEHL